MNLFFCFKCYLKGNLGYSKRGLNSNLVTSFVFLIYSNKVPSSAEHLALPFKDIRNTTNCIFNIDMFISIRLEANIFTKLILLI